MDFIPATAKVVDDEDQQAMIEAVKSWGITSNSISDKFERELAPWMGHTLPGLFCNSGSSANLIAVTALGLEPGDEVITTALGFPTTVAPIIQNGAIPVFVDVHERTLNTTLELVQAAKTKKTKAVVLAHTLGNIYRADLISEWCKQNDVLLVEDCCDALGGRIGENAIGSFGDFSTLSFYPAHHITTGEGGAVFCRDAKRRKTAQSIRDWGRDCWCDPGKDNTCGKRFSQCHGGMPHGYDHKYTYSTLGYNLKGTDIQASLGRSQLKKLPGFIECRKHNWNRLYGWAVKQLQVMPFTPTENPNWFGFPIRCSGTLSRNKLVQYLEKHGVGTRMVFGGNITKQPGFRYKQWRICGDLENTDMVMNKVFWIACGPHLTDEKIDYMIKTLENGIKEISNV